jgi:hypothetical protein
MIGAPASLEAGGQRTPLPSAVHWITRGLLVGVAHGAAVGSVIPLLGTIAGVVFGTGAGVVIGIAVAVVSSTTRRLWPHENGAVQLRERVIAVLLITTPAVLLAIFGKRIALFQNPLYFLVSVFPGVMHSCIAGTPTSNHPFSGDVSVVRRHILALIPLLVGVLMVALFFTFADTVDL